MQYAYAFLCPRVIFVVVVVVVFKAVNTFIQQGCFKLIKSDNKDIYNVTRDFYFKYMLFFHQCFLSSKSSN